MSLKHEECTELLQHGIILYSSVFLSRHRKQCLGSGIGARQYAHEVVYSFSFFARAHFFPFFETITMHCVVTARRVHGMNFIFCNFV